MIRCFLLLATLFALSSCGADGAPTAPAPEPGLSVHGTVKVGVSGSL